MLKGTILILALIATVQMVYKWYQQDYYLSQGIKPQENYYLLIAPILWGVYFSL